MMMNNSMDVEIPVLAGYLNVPTQTGFSLNRISKKRTCNRYCLLFKSSRHGIERLEICENKDDKNPKIFTLENCVKITQEPPPANLIQIVKKNGTLTLNTLTEEDLKEWVNALQTVAFCDNSTAHAPHGAIEEDNDLYCSSFDGLFIITLIPSEASIRCNIEPKAYMLQMTATELQLKSVEDLNVVIAMWPYRFIRKYGYRDGKFTFEAGRKCTTGEGVFTLDHTNPQEVFRCMSAKMKSMKKLISGDSLSSIECVENQFSAAASMEPGSRSPLPPSPSNQHTNEFEMNSTQSCVSLRGFLSSNDSLNNFSINTAHNTNSTNVVPIINVPVSVPVSTVSTVPVTVPVPPSLKNIPNKPPRKLPTPMDKSTNSNISNSNNSSNSNNNSNSSSDKFKKILNYEPVAITTSSTTSSAIENTTTTTNNINNNNNNNNNNNKNSCSSTVILKPATLSSSVSSLPPDLPLRNESAKYVIDRDYECIEHITDAWKTLGVSDVKHCERIADNETTTSATSSSSTTTTSAFDFVWQRSQSQRDKRKDLTVKTNQPTTKIIDIDIGEGSISNINVNTTAAAVAGDATYDRLDFLSPNNKTSSGYKTIVTVSSPINRLRCSPPTLQHNEYELIASPDTEICRKADDSHLGYGILRKPTINNNNNSNSSSSNITNSNNCNISSSNNNSSNNNATISLAICNSNSNNNNNLNDISLARGNTIISTTPAATTTTTTPTITINTHKQNINNNSSNNENLDHRNYNGLNYTIVSKPKRV